MIALLKGRVEAYEDDGVILDVGGVGYHVTCSSRTLAALPRVGEVGKLFTEMLVSENAIRLVGFANEAERAWFRLLDNVQGVGTRVALAVLSTLSTSRLSESGARSRRCHRAPPPMPSRRWSISAMARPRPVRRSAVRCRRRALTRQPRS